MNNEIFKEMEKIERSFLSIDELKTCSLKNLQEHEDKAWDYYTKIRAVKVLTKEIENEVKNANTRIH